jgi:hypothetical protein
MKPIDLGKNDAKTDLECSQLLGCRELVIMVEKPSLTQR